MSKQPFSDFLVSLKAADTEAALGIAEDYVAANLGQFPVAEGNTAHFLALQRPGYFASVVGEWTGFDVRQGLMEPIGGGLLHYRHDFEPDARLDYMVAYIPEKMRARLDNWRSLIRLTPEMFRDHFNTRTGESGFGKRSEVVMPQYNRAPESVPDPNTPRGQVIDEIIGSKVLGQQRLYSVYLPHGYDKKSAPLPAAYFHDGTDYLTMGEATTVLDNLIAAGKIPPIAAVFVPPQERTPEYNCNSQFARFFADELIARLNSRYDLSDDPRHRAVIGPSMGGIGALYIGWARQDKFRLIGAQSAVVQGFGRAARFDARKEFVDPPDGFKVHLVVGSYEGCFSRDRQGNCRDLLTGVRELRDVLKERKFNYRYVEPHHSHSWGLWRDTLPDMLTFLFGL